jgi:hypothetical protein
LLIVSFGAISFISLIGSITLAMSSVDLRYDNDKAKNFVGISFAASAVGLGYVMPLLLLPSSPVGAVVLLALDFVLLLVFAFVLPDRSR